MKAIIYLFPHVAEIIHRIINFNFIGTSCRRNPTSCLKNIVHMESTGKTIDAWQERHQITT